ncbi:maltoporin [Aeromonas salmonicida]|uniref:maltoporin n=1 Tax=Aeromonas salmonicida TaxID=645 RepID=UPI0011125AFE|nr:maltoporin [Aeromonas salmonicida]MDE7527176.1 maltoporin [Aeromonas salmonicida]MDE7531599.1 maltoporin [Aeromonas salmonicida]HDN9019180.1 maltoporin [Aeromonas salmonicida]
MTMKVKLLTTSVALALSMTAFSSNAVDFSGYFRSGVGVSQDGDMQTGNQSLVGRLGNESDTYTEIGIGQEVYNKDGKVFYVDSMFSMQSNGSNDYESTATVCDFDKKQCSEDATFALRQFNVKAKGLISAAPDAVVWAGKRFYQRHDLHIIDTKYWNISGAGAGIENLKVGPGAFSLAWIRSDGNDIDNSIVDNDLNVNFLDLRYAGWAPWEGAWTEAGVSYAMPNPTDEQKATGGKYDPENGVMLTAEMSQYFAGSGINEKLVLQYANKGLAQNMISQGGGWYDVWQLTDDAKGYRVILTGDIPLGDKFSVNHVFTYGKGEKLQEWHDNTELFSAVARGGYAWTDIMKTLVEAGTYESTKTWTSGAEDKSSGQKYTLAQAWSAGPSMFARPEIRVFASYLKDGEGESFNGGEDDSTWNFGVQAEAWW